MQVFDYLHVVRWDDDADVAQGFHFPTLETSEADGSGTCLAGHRERIQYILGISAAADGKSDILRLDEISQLLRKDILIIGIVGPRRHSGNIVSEGEHTEPLPSVAISRALSEIARKMRGQRCAASVSKQIHHAPRFIGLHQFIGDLVDSAMRKRDHDSLQLLEILPGIQNLSSVVHIVSAGN